MSFATLERCDGPPCPRCGCQDVEILSYPPVRTENGWRGSWFDAGRAVCRHCRLQFTFRELPQNEAVEAAEPITLPIEPDLVAEHTIRVVQCSDCGIPMKATSTRKDVRYHKCPHCGKTAKTAR